jgi:putative ABC transport system ATP-binding protein
VSLLSIENVSKRYRRGPREYVALRGVSLAIQRGELVVVLGSRKSGRSTLLRIAAGLERPDGGIVRFEGTALSAARNVVGRRISYGHTAFSPMQGERVLDHVAAALLAQGVSAGQATRAAEQVSARTGVADCAGMQPAELTGAERVRVAIARALAPGPALLVLDDPTTGVGLLQSDGILRLLRSLADEGVAVLMSTDDATCVSGADRAFSLHDGQLRCDVQAPQADVVPLRPRNLEIEPGARLG